MEKVLKNVSVAQVPVPTYLCVGLKTSSNMSRVAPTFVRSVHPFVEFTGQTFRNDSK